MAIKWVDGQLVQMEVSTDITDRKLAEIELIRAKEKAEESDKLKSAFLANVSHEVRTPLNGITGFLSFFDNDDLSPMQRREYINIVKNSSTQLVKLIDDIVDMAKIETKQMSINPIPTNINSLMKEKQTLFERYLQNNNKEHIALILDDNEFIDGCVSFVDPTRLRQVLNNLMNNAIKFTEKGFIRFGYRQSAPGELEFVVEDTGIGLAEGMHEAVFERFRQAELTNSRLYGGTGLGLNIARHLVQMMGGDMRVESTEGAGSSFYFTISYLPVTPEDLDIFDDSKIIKSLNKESLESLNNILVVEPVPMKFKYYEKLISAAGAFVIHAQNLQQWVEIITKNPQIDMVIADASVFINEDVDSIRQIKNIRADLPIVLVLSGEKENYRQIINESRCDGTIEMPVDYAGIARVLGKN
jgi:nitrogen-specific signal transduction histidine kinase